MISPQILVISGFLSIMWGVYLIATVREYVTVHTRLTDLQRRRGDAVAALRRVVVAFCLWAIVFSSLFRSVMILLGLGDGDAGQITFFALLGTNVAGSIFVVVSMRYD